ncbi:S-adenosylmethionine:tRNA ribosyltransferase-isomerase [Candidatus Sulfidibacterium hydrothermale]|uniref:S-adenosylmethionine:tRNA ribosyltransferase-isomerase n=1 Tax=Candidatus Sulfidibacterium hydrothermale TaxID=2875962 RepID=UPI001F0B2703|nr:S-adenosylmethionine:tRNA ribosyltransferase-isomerase [Candidatus Sulfidibacterium hydrothermale]UBM62757.1 S-adenosylmethionine:tRNA ribosyltransferase-isomerase [Candidatus Sulfidibacterium hydrothermale]
MDVTGIKIDDYDYPLPDEKIAKYPLAQRDQSKLLLLKDGEISQRKFSEIPDLLPSDSLLLFNETRVIQARLLFQKSTGAQIEIFCLEPVEPVNDFQLAFQQSPPVVWKCFVGNARRWKSGPLQTELTVANQPVILQAEVKEKLSDAFLISFSWDKPALSFADILETSGHTPLPPYLHREAEETDKTRYQTVYARLNGSVAAPTAGLHFTEKILQQLDEKGIDKDRLILHVGAGTFKPVSADTIGKHEMHTEQIRVSLRTLKHLYRASEKKIIPVGTTSMRSLESLFWMALRLHKNLPDPFHVQQWDPYQLSIPEDFSSRKALDVLIRFLEKEQSNELKGTTQLIIVPGYTFRYARGIVTNFHQPKSTLLLLVSALIGPRWKEAYRFALQNDFRFLSYGDSCLFLP